MRRSAAGFTLVELMVVVAIAGLLVAIAIPSYNSYVLSANRAKAIVWANQLAAKQEVYYSRRFQYGNLTQLDNAGLDTPFSAGELIAELGDKYRIRFRRTVDTYRIRLWPEGNQANDSANCRFIEVTEQTALMEATSDLERYCP